MQPPRRPELPPDFLFRLWKTGMILAVGAVFFTVGCIAAVVFWPRSLVPAAVVVVGGSLLVYIYRDRIVSSR